ncbi:hypothetical protein IW140_005447 [Coemansia sp. RSA 1813]|nr:hypothetical protein LPJ74_004543 [Coemansia sp. RSA 1843]KAJ2086912.1 hypothetical protein IW138_005327 [Coemansia sp. RSA 986]KAJ2211613.1 hypothetical protein EV179_005335 [Coemansia sp. RSA 487]KAJ2565189.1 hypothetical protein IW140_005447 [Coemansia sp. RSA 1813]
MQTGSGQSSQAFPRFSDFATDKRVHYADDAGCYVFTDPKDGVRYEYDQDKSAWFPMWNESLVAKQQSAYGTAEQDMDSVTGIQGPKRKNRETVGKRENTSVYVSGLPVDATENEVVEYFSQCGAIMPDILTNTPRVKLYRNKEGIPKGDALVTYYKAPSVQIAVDILDDSQFRASERTRINVQQAEFRERGDDGQADKKQHTDTDKSKRTHIDTKLKKKRLGRLEKKLDWTEDSNDVADRHKRTVILKHMFAVEELKEDVTLLLELTEDVRTECEKLGTVASVKIFDTMNGRFFAGRQVEAGIYDGHTRYRSSNKTRNEPGEMANAERNAGDDEDERMEKYAQWLDSGQV